MTHPIAIDASERGLTVDVAKTLFRPVFAASKNGDRSDDQRDIAAAIKTYRYLRIGMIVIVLALGISIWLVNRTVDCWQGSISAYYYTDARPIFVSGLIAISVSLIVIKGSTIIEDTLLNFAGMLAPIVAFVPTSDEGACLPGKPLGEGTSGLPNDIVREAQNNLGAMLVAGFAALLVAAFVFYRDQVGRDRPSIGDTIGRVGLLVVTTAALVVSSIMVANDEILDYHGWAAVFMFGFLAAAAIANGVWLLWANRRDGRETSKRWKLFAFLYLFVGVTMGVAGAVIKFGIDEWDHQTLVLEATEIGLFVAMWAVQSFERWGTIMHAKPPPATETVHAAVS